jgi:ATP/maltotriose-dependent transcriptional regulator MalT
LPEGTISRDAPLALVKAWLSALSGRREECEEYLAHAEGVPHEEGPLPDGTASVEAGVATLRATFAFGGVGDMAQAGHVRPTRRGSIEPPRRLRGRSSGSG